MTTRRRSSELEKFSTIVSSTGAEIVNTIKNDLGPTVDRYFAPIKGLISGVAHVVKDDPKQTKGRTRKRT